MKVAPSSNFDWIKQTLYYQLTFIIAVVTQGKENKIKIKVQLQRETKKSQHISFPFFEDITVEAEI
jgi:hypothetical protein